MRLTSPVVVLVLLAMAGCGGSEDTFTADYNRAVRPVRALRGDLGRRAADFDRLAGRIKATRANLAKLDPPDDARDEMDSLLVGLSDVTRDLKRVARSIRSKDPVKSRRAARRLVRSNAEVGRAETALKRAVEN